MRKQISRRSAIGATAGFAIAAASSLVAGRPLSSASTELVAWRAARTAYWNAVERVDDCLTAGRRARGAHALFESPVYVALDAEMGDACRVLDAAVERIQSRPVRSVHDLAELAEMVRGEKWWGPGDYDPEDDDAPDPLVIALFDAVNSLAQTGIAE